MFNWSKVLTRSIFCLKLQNIGSFTDVQLKALLDEAITYKTPKDRENKSETFKVCNKLNCNFIKCVFCKWNTLNDNFIWDMI